MAIIRPVRYADLPALKTIFESSFAEEYERRGVDLQGQFARWHQMYPLVRALSLFPNPYQYTMNLLVAEEGANILGFVQTSPGNHQRTRWHVDYMAVAPQARAQGVASAMLDHVIELYGPQGIKSFTLEVDTRNPAGLALGAKKGFRQYATLFYYQLDPEVLRHIEPSPPPEGLRPYRPRDAQGLVDLYDACTPSSVRLIDSRSAGDFELGFIEHTFSRWRRKLGLFEDLRYVVEDAQRRVVGYLRLLGHFKPNPQSLWLMVHPGYEHLYDPLLSFAMGKLRGFPENLVLAWAPDYQTTKREHFEQAGFSLLTADHLLVRDTVLTMRMPLPHLQRVDEASLKPAFCEP